jgi:DNA-directed RNA polymerase subunit RPC12/RpoP
MQAAQPEVVRCIECRHEYDAPAYGEEMACPECGSKSWISARIAYEPLQRVGRTG